VEVYERPADAFVASFIGENNRLDGRILGRDGDRLIVELSGGVQIRARSVEGVSAGDSVVFGVRPERVRLDTAGCENWLRLPIQNVVYLGDSSRLILAWPGGGEFTVKLDRAAAIAGFAPGGEVQVGWTAEDGLVFPR
jgi:putative spermidine/putrescine transport system ATP-binding protein